ncbi:MAG TPA: alpha-amylase family glycosyl hydrolase [Parafilimonas sp.]|nr:alpha-amylase family glycosyl hydrolase [Parafilimonas sp.]
MRKLFGIVLLLVFITTHGVASSIILHAKSATVWLPKQTVKGELIDFSARTVTVHFNDSIFSVQVDHDEFAISIFLKKGTNIICVEAANEQQHITSDTVEFKLGYTPLPVVKPYATRAGDKIFLHALVKENPYDVPISFTWASDKNNPAPASIINTHDSAASFTLPRKKGDYRFHLTVVAGDDTAMFATFVTRTDSIHCFNIESDHAAWIDSAVIYQVTPSIFVKDGHYDDITPKLPEIKQFGINTIYLQPVFETHAGGQGYDITDYFSLRKDLGTEAQLRDLITTAKSLGIRVLFDFVPNHTSVFHPYVADAVLYGRDSHYYDFYQRADDGSKYSSLYKRDDSGFYHYFWNKLVNLNYQNPEVEQWIIEACKYWLKKFDIDGYRFDAVWAVSARDPSFAKRLQLELKSIKPDILLIAEDKAANAQVFEAGYDAAYDWTADTSWISHWSWQYHYDPAHNPTIFNYPNENERGNMLRHALFQNGDSIHLRLRFMENNDQPAFIKDHDVACTKMVAALLFSLPGIPLLYNGQEIGHAAKVYSKAPVFQADKSIRSLDSGGLYNYYQKLIALRSRYKSLRGTHMKDLPVNCPNNVVAVYRWQEAEKFVVIVSLGGNAQQVSVDLNDVIKQQNKNLFFTDVLTNETFTSSSLLTIRMQPQTARLLLIKD